jgi:hypothetical protein
VVFPFKILHFNLKGMMLSVLHVTGDVADRHLHTLHLLWVDRVDMKALRRDPDQRIVLVLIHQAHGFLSVHEF